MSNLENRVALVTGGGRGIGRGIAYALAKQGVKVAIAARTDTEINKVAAEINQQGGEAIAYTLDVADLAAVQATVQAIEDTWGGVDILVNNAGMLGPIDPLVQADPIEWVRTQEVNLIGAYFCLRAVLPHMLAQNWGRVANISSGAGLGSGIMHLGAYSVSKASMDMLSRSADSETSNQGVFINSIYPGVVETDMQVRVRNTPIEQASEETHYRFMAFQSNGLLTEPIEVGEQIVAILRTDLHGEVLDVREFPVEARAFLA